MCLGYVYITCSVMKVVITVPLPIKPILSTVMFMNNRKTPGTRNILKNPWSSFAVWSAKITDNVLDLFCCFSNQNFLLLWVGLLWKLGNSCLHIEYFYSTHMGEDLISNNVHISIIWCEIGKICLHSLDQMIQS